jgi:hypothetical protein
MLYSKAGFSENGSTTMSLEQQRTVYKYFMAKRTQ